MDLSLPDTDGLDCIRQLRSAGCRVPLLVVTAHTAAGLVSEALAAGAQGHVLKTSQPDELRRAVSEVAAGRAYVQAGLAAGDSYADKPRLTTLEREALLLVARGEPLAELGLSERTLQSHLRSLYRKLGVESLEHAVVQARELGLIVVDPHERKSL